MYTYIEEVSPNISLFPTISASSLAMRRCSNSRELLGAAMAPQDERRLNVTYKSYKYG